MSIEQQMIEGYKAMAEENKEIAREATGRKEMKEMDREVLWYKLKEMADDWVTDAYVLEILAEFDRLTEAYDNEVLLSSQRAYEIKSLKDSLEHYQADYRNLLKDSEALERICDAWGRDDTKGWLESCGCPTCKRLADYLDLQPKPIEFDCAECGETLTVTHTCIKEGNHGASSSNCGLKIEKPKDEEVLRGILQDSGCFTGKPIEMEGLRYDILTHFQLKEGE